MGVGPNYILSKGFVATGSTAYAFGECVVASGDGTKVARATSGAADVIGICGEALDAAKATTGKAVIKIDLLGITRVKVGAAVAVRDRLKNDTSARGVTATKAIAGAQPAFSFGIALTAATAANQFVDVLLTPGGQF